MIDLALLNGWIPYRVQWRGAGPEVDWLFMGERTFREPFFDHTIRSMLRDPYHLSSRRQTSITDLADLGAARPGLPLAGLIFHMSRCGSTLISRLLAVHPEHLVISEAPPIDEVLDTIRQNVPEETRIAWLRGMVAALGQQRTGHEQRMFIKLDSWHIHDLPLIRRAFPHTPWIFIYRDPVEVIVSHQRLRGSQMAPGQIAPMRLGLEDSAIQVPFNLDQFCARVIGRFCEAAALAIPTYDGLPVNYRHFPEAIWSTVMPHFGVRLNEARIEEMALELQYHAKQPAHPFVPDSQAKQQAVSATTRELADRYIAPAYAKLELLQHERVR